MSLKAPTDVVLEIFLHKFIDDLFRQTIKLNASLIQDHHFFIFSIKLLGIRTSVVLLDLNNAIRK
jgi:hypothetical protein